MARYTPLRKSCELQYMQRQLLQSSTPLPYNKNYTSQKNDAVSTLLSVAGPLYYAEAGANGIHLPG